MDGKWRQERGNNLSKVTRTGFEPRPSESDGLSTGSGSLCFSPVQMVLSFLGFQSVAQAGMGSPLLFSVSVLTGKWRST